MAARLRSGTTPASCVTSSLQSRMKRPECRPELCYYSQTSRAQSPFTNMLLTGLHHSLIFDIPLFLPSNSSIPPHHFFFFAPPPSYVYILHVKKVSHIPFNFKGILNLFLRDLGFISQIMLHLPWHF